MTLDDLIKKLNGDVEGVTLVFNDGVTEYTYGIRVAHVGPDHVTLTWDVEEEYYPTHPNRVLQSTND